MGEKVGYHVGSFSGPVHGLFFFVCVCLGGYIDHHIEVGIQQREASSK